MPGALLAAGVALSGCGVTSALLPKHGAGDGGQAPAVRAVIAQFARSIANGDGQTGCALLDQNAQQQLASDGGQAGQANPSPGACAATISLIAPELSESARATLSNVSVGNVAIAGDVATVDPTQVHGPTGARQPLSGAPGARPIMLERQDGSWLIDDLGG